MVKPLQCYGEGWDMKMEDVAKHGKTRAHGSRHKAQGKKEVIKIKAQGAGRKAQGKKCDIRIKAQGAGK
jgi:hypothetical protein